MSTKDGGPAFPHVVRRVAPNVVEQITDGGMSLRDYFAAKAMQGFCADPSNASTYKTKLEMCEHAYIVADRMLAARGVTP